MTAKKQKVNPLQRPAKPEFLTADEIVTRLRHRSSLGLRLGALCLQSTTVFSWPMNDVTTPDQRLLFPDVRLFTTGACHIFAVMLYSRIDGAGFEMHRISAKPTPWRSECALHVYVSKSGQAFDVRGLHSEETLLQEYFSRRDDNSVNPWKGVEAVATCANELLAVDYAAPERQGRRWLRSQWDLILDPTFVNRCQYRAEVFISLFGKTLWPDLPLKPLPSAVALA